MNKSNRDLLIMFKQELMSPQAMEHEVSLLHELLFTVERLDNIVTAHEIIDLNKYKIISKSFIVKESLRQSKEIPFVFVNNKN